MMSSAPPPPDPAREAFLARAVGRRSATPPHDALELEFKIIGQLRQARHKAGLSQEAVAAHMGTTKSAISRLEGAGKHTPSLDTLRRYAQAVGCELRVDLLSPD